VPETAVAQQSLLTGDKDVISDTLPTDIPRLQQEGLLQVTSGSNFSYIVFNQHPESAPIVKEVGKNPFTDVKVREAITLSFDVDAAISAVYPAELASTIRAYGPVPNTSWAYDKTLPDTAPKPDVNRAKQLLAEAGYPNGFKTELLVVNDAARVAAAQIFQNALSQIGIEASISTPQIGQILERANSQTYDIGIFGWGGLSSDPDYYVEPLLATANRGPGGNNAYYSNPEVDGLIRESLATSVREDRKKAFDQIQQIVQQDYVFIPLFYQPAQLGVAKKVKDLKVASDKMYRLVTEDANVWISE
jgi:ABC-type transport system substrate-binding protein